MSSFRMEVGRLSLGNISSQLEEQFQHALIEIREHFADESIRLQPNSRSAEVTIKLKFTHELDSRATFVATSISTKLPKYRQVSRPLVLPRGGAHFLIEDEGDQGDFFGIDSAEGVQ